MRRIISAALIAGSLTFVGFAPAHAAGTLTITSASTDRTISSVAPSATVSIGTDHDGTVSVDYHLDPDGGTPSATIVHVDRSTDGAGNFSFDVTADGLPDGVYWIDGDVTVTDGDGDGNSWTTSFENATYRPGVAIDRTGPVVTGNDPYLSVIRPESTTDANTFMNITAYGDAQTGDDFVLFGPTGAKIGALSTQVSLGDQWYTEWAGQGTNGLLPAGTYTIRLRDTLGNLSSTAFTVRLERLATKTLTRTVTARASKVFQQAGACSSVKSPSTHGWTGSISLLSNSRCHRTVRASTVVTAHAVKLPTAVSYATVQVKVYGGAARRAGGSRAQLMYLKGSSGAITTPTTLGATVGTHAGPRLSATNLLLKDTAGSYLFWYAAVAGGNRYDVKNFTVTVRYQVWS